MFYVMNRYHDELYKLGFNEGAYNFQHENFGRGGAGNDR
ncbi:MAG: M36 family metallopeptidase, partial [Flavobacteriales bacterium]